MTPAWDAPSVASFYDAYGEREWTRFEDGRFSAHGLDLYVEHLRRFVSAGDRVLDIGAGPGRFTIELARIGADVVVADLSPGQLELNRQHVAAAGAEARVLERVVADITDLSRWKDASFDATVCYGGPLSYVLDRADQSVAELVRVTKPGGHVLITAMSLIGTFQRALSEILDLVRRDGAKTIEEIVRTGVLPAEPDYGHSSKETPIILPAKLYRWSELEALLSRHGTVVAAAAAGLLRPKQPVEPELQGLLSRIELALAVEPGALSCGEHLLAVLRREP
jgi:ubiquinone/menaquinone biosynthesis C-methylase UbiE